MIGKLDIIKDTENMIKTDGLTTNIAKGSVINKINELIDVVNGMQNLWFEVVTIKKIILELQAKTEILQEHAHPTATTEPVDQYAEQKKWIGKACWFWDPHAQTKTFGLLNQIDIDEQNVAYQTNFGGWYECCEPAEAADVIYKGNNDD